MNSCVQKDLYSRTSVEHNNNDDDEKMADIVFSYEEKLKARLLTTDKLLRLWQFAVNFVSSPPLPSYYFIKIRYHQSASLR
jgi:hypothetical protein